MVNPPESSRPALLSYPKCVYVHAELCAAKHMQRCSGVRLPRATEVTSGSPANLCLGFMLPVGRPLLCCRFLDDYRLPLGFPSAVHHISHDTVMVGCRLAVLCLVGPPLAVRRVSFGTRWPSFDLWLPTR